MGVDRDKLMLGAGWGVAGERERRGKKAKKNKWYKTQLLTNVQLIPEQHQLW